MSVPHRLGRERPPISTAGRKVFGVEALDLQRGEGLQLIPTEVGIDPVDGHRVAVVVKRRSFDLVVSSHSAG